MFNHAEADLDDPPPAVLSSDTFLFDAGAMTLRPCPALPIPQDHEVGCSGFPALTWGALFKAGGHRPLASPPTIGTDRSLVFDPVNEQWTDRLSSHLIPPMSVFRHYAMTLVLPPIGNERARVWTIGGGQPSYEIYDVADGTWSPPGSVPQNLGLLNYALAHLVPNNFQTGGFSGAPGLVFCPNATSTVQPIPTFFFDPQPAASPVWLSGPDRVSGALRAWGGSVILCRPDPADATRYRCMIVLIGGCCRPATPPDNFTDQAYDTIEFIEDPSDPSAVWNTSAVTLSCDRVFLEAIVFPTGQIGIFGGLTTGGALWNPPTPPPIKPAPAARTTNVEIYTPPPVGAPSGDSIAIGAPDPVVRGYHSAAVLLDDGRVFQVGGEQTNASLICPIAPGWCDLTLYEPPYLHQGPRPSNLTATGSMTYGASIDITVTLPAGDSLGKVVLTRPCTSTHHVDFDQRYIELRVPDPPAGSGTVAFSAVLPSSEYVAPPGYYMLWVLTSGADPVPVDRAAFLQIR